jgi:hypothetical protein
MSERVTSPGVQDLGPATVAQMAPDQGYGFEIYQLVLKDVIERSEFGARKYGQPLRTTAAVDHLVNAYQELLDLLIYLRGEIHQRDQLVASAMDCLDNRDLEMVLVRLAERLERDLHGPIQPESKYVREDAEKLVDFIKEHFK